MNNRQNQGLIQARQRMKIDNPGLAGYLVQQAKQSIRGLTKPLHLIPSVLIIIIWYVLSITAGQIVEKTGNLNLPMWHQLADFLTYSQGGMYGRYIATLGSIIGKAVVMAFLNSMIVGLLEKKRPFSNAALGISNLKSSLNMKGVHDISPVSLGLGFALIAYGLMNTRQGVDEAVVAIYAIVMILKNMGENGGFLKGLIYSAAISFGKRHPADVTVHRILTGNIIGFVIAIILSFTSVRPCIWIGLFFLIISLIFKQKKNTRAPYALMIAIILLPEIMLALFATCETKAAAGFSSTLENGSEQLSIEIDGGTFNEEEANPSDDTAIQTIKGQIRDGERIQITVDSETKDGWTMLIQPEGGSEWQKDLEGKQAKFGFSLTDKDSYMGDDEFFISKQCNVCYLSFWNGNMAFQLSVIPGGGNYLTGTMDDFTGLYRAAIHMPVNESENTAAFSEWSSYNGRTLDGYVLVYMADGQYYIDIPCMRQNEVWDQPLLWSDKDWYYTDSLETCGKWAEMLRSHFGSFDKVVEENSLLRDTYSNEYGFFYIKANDLETEWDEKTHTIHTQYKRDEDTRWGYFDYDIIGEFSLANDGTLRLTGHQKCDHIKTNYEKRSFPEGEYLYNTFDFEGVKLDFATGKDAVYSEMPEMKVGNHGKPAAKENKENDTQENGHNNESDDTDDKDKTNIIYNQEPLDTVTPDMKEIPDENDWDEHDGVVGSVARTTVGVLGAVLFGMAGFTGTGFESFEPGYRVNNEGDISFIDPASGRDFKYYYIGQDSATGEKVFLSSESMRNVTESDINSVYETRTGNVAYYGKAELDAAINTQYIREHTDAKLQQDQALGKTEAERDIANAVFKRQFEEKRLEKYGERYLMDREGVMREIRQRQIADAVEGDTAMAKSIWMNYGAQTANQISTVADVSINVLGEITGPAGKSIKRIYSYAKPALTKYEEALLDRKRGMELVKDVGQGLFEAGMDHINDSLDSYNAQVITSGLKTALTAYRDGKNITEELEKGFVKDSVSYGFGKIVEYGLDKLNDAVVKRLTENLKIDNSYYRTLGAWKEGFLEKIFTREYIHNQTKALKRIEAVQQLNEIMKSFIKDSTSQIKYDFEGGSGFGNYQETFDPDNATGWIDDGIDKVGDGLHSYNDWSRKQVGIDSEDIVGDAVKWVEELKESKE